MTKREVASLAFTIAGIYALVQAIPLIGQLVSWFQMLATAMEKSDSAKFGEWGLITIAIILPFAGLVFVGYLFIARSRKFALRMFPRGLFPEEGAAPGAGASATDLQVVAFSVVGILVVAIALPHLLNGAAYLAYAYVRAEPAKQIPWTSWAYFVAGLLQLGLGVGLFFGGRGLASYWRKARPLSGVREEEPSDAEMIL